MKLLALDLGERRIGLAVGDTATALAFPAGHIVRSGLSRDIERTLEAGRERGIDGFVAGMPYSLDGSAGTQAKRAQGFIDALRKRTTMPVFTVDERFTSVEAEAILRESGREPSRRKGSVDEAAAALILERFLSTKGHEVSRKD